MEQAVIFSGTGAHFVKYASVPLFLSMRMWRVDIFFLFYTMTISKAEDSRRAAKAP